MLETPSCSIWSSALANFSRFHSKITFNYQKLVNGGCVRSINSGSAFRHFHLIITGQGWIKCAVQSTFRLGFVSFSLLSFLPLTGSSFWMRKVGNKKSFPLSFDRVSKPMIDSLWCACFFRFYCCCVTTEAFWRLNVELPFCPIWLTNQITARPQTVLLPTEKNPKQKNTLF